MRQLQVGGLKVKVTDRKSMLFWNTFQIPDACKLLLPSTTTSICHGIYHNYVFQKLQTKKVNRNYQSILMDEYITSLNSPKCSLENSRFVSTQTHLLAFIFYACFQSSLPCFLKQYRIYTERTLALVLLQRLPNKKLCFCLQHFLLNLLPILCYLTLFITKGEQISHGSYT